ncbi:MAG: glycoside hydrolase family 32 protein [Lachnospiraceae bacterium]|nr:glycoside hydrolase family 32 protein [Lachnospiraceae bacterium]
MGTMVQAESSQLKLARTIEKKGILEIPSDARPIYHLSSPVGWMNDPNGFSVFQEEYHLFFQYHPFSKAWGPMHWGHSKSKDFIRWEYLPAAMAPDERYDEGGCYSGSAIEAAGEHVLLYTGVMDRYLEDGTHDYCQVQCMAKGDGRDYTKYQGNPVIASDSLPEGGSAENFRDPKIWKEGAYYYLVVGNCNADGDGQILLYRSDNLEQWEFLTVLDQSRGKYGKMWECPDFFPLGNRQILMVSPQDMRAVGYEFHNGNNSVFIYGTYDKLTYQFEREKIMSVDYGLDFYAPQTLQTADGRRVMVGWMQSWDAKLTNDFCNWSGMMTLPRELILKEGKIYQSPVRELESYRKNKVEYIGKRISETAVLEGIRGRVIDLQIDITEFGFHHFAIHFACNEEYEMLLQYNHLRKCLTIDRTHSGLVRDVVCRRKMAAEPFISETQKEVLRLRLLLDRYSAEVFLNGGEKVMSAVFHTPMEADGIVFDTDGTVCMDVLKYDICI